MKLLKRMSAVLMAFAVMFTSLSLTANAEGEQSTVTITWNANGGTFADGTTEQSGTMTPGCTNVFHGGPVYADGTKVCDGWTTASEEDDTVYTYFTVPEVDTTYYAHWIDAVQLTFDANGGSYGDTTSVTISVPKGKNASESNGYYSFMNSYHTLTNGTGFTAPAGGYTLTGWSLTQDGKNKIELTDAQRYDADTTVYAIWEKAVTVTVNIGDTATLNSTTLLNPSWFGLDLFTVSGVGDTTYFRNAGILSADKKSVTFTVPEGTTLHTFYASSFISNTTESTGKAFLGWATDAAGTVLLNTYASAQLTENTTLYAVWGDAVEVTLNANGGTFPGGTTEMVQKFSMNTVLNTASMSNYYPSLNDSTKQFYGWSTTTDESGLVIDRTGKTYELGTEPVTLYAIYKESTQAEVTVTLEANGKGYFVEAGARKDKIEFSATKNTIWSFTTHMGQYRATSRGFVANDGYALIGWSTNKDATYADDMTKVTEDVTLYPVLTTGYHLTLDPGDATWREGSSVYQTYIHDYNNVLQPQGMDLNTLNSTFGSNYGAYTNKMSEVFDAPENTLFLGWTTVKNDKSTMVKFGDTLQADTTLYAYFDEKATIVLDANGGYFNDSEKNRTLTYTVAKGSEQNMYANPTINGDKVFAGWSTTKDESGLVSGSSYGSLVLTSAESGTYYAIYTDALVITYDMNGDKFDQTGYDKYSMKVAKGQGMPYYGSYVGYPYKEGKIHIGWTDAKPGTTITSDNVVLSMAPASKDFIFRYLPTKSMTLYPLWADPIRVTLHAGEYGQYIESYGMTPADNTYVEERTTSAYAKGFVYASEGPMIKDEYFGKVSFVGFSKTPDGEAEFIYDEDAGVFPIEEAGTYYAVYKWLVDPTTQNDTPSETPSETPNVAPETVFEETATNQVITEVEKTVKPATAAQAEVKAQKMMNSLRSKVEGTVVEKSAVESAPGSAVMIDSIEQVKNEAAIDSLQQVVTSVMKSTMEADTTIRDVKLVELNARGSGSVRFLVGKEYAGTIAVVGHYHNGIWTTQQCKVDRNGYITPQFTSFSPIAIMLTTATEELSNLETAAEPTALPVSEANVAPVDAAAQNIAAANGDNTVVKSPKTGENRGYFFFLVGMMCFAGAVICYALSRKKQYN